MLFTVLAVIVAAPLRRHLEGIDFKVSRKREVQYMPRPDDANTDWHRACRYRPVRLGIDWSAQAGVGVVAVGISIFWIARDHLHAAM